MEEQQGMVLWAEYLIMLIWTQRQSDYLSSAIVGGVAESGYR